VERTTAVELIGDAASASGGHVEASAVGPDAEASAEGPEASPAAQDAGGAEGGSACTIASAVCTVSSPACSVGSYLLYDNQWNCGGSTGNTCGPESALGCSDGDGGTVAFVVTSEQAPGTTVLTYPAMQTNFVPAVPVDSLHVITSAFSERGPLVGTYEFAYDMWFNGVGSPGATQILVWVDDFNRTPEGTRVATASLGGRTYGVWRTPDGLHLVFAATPSFSSGAVDLRAIVDFAIAQGWLSTTATVGQIDFGIEIASTGGTSATFEVDGYSLTTN
jgi:hypothetical protein